MISEPGPIALQSWSRGCCDQQGEKNQPGFEHPSDKQHPADLNEHARVFGEKQVPVFRARVFMPGQAGISFSFISFKISFILFAETSDWSSLE
jgi:hypothetical protein